MGQRGPAKTPRELSVLKGGKDSRIQTNTPVPPPGEPDKPDHLSPKAAEIWDQVMDQMRATRAIRPPDGLALAVLCEHYAIWLEAKTQLVADGPTVEGQKGETVKHPLAQVVRDNAAIVRAFAREFGLTPSARSGITLPEKPDNAEGAERFLSG